MYNYFCWSTAHSQPHEYLSNSPSKKSDSSRTLDTIKIYTCFHTSLHYNPFLLPSPLHMLLPLTPTPHSAFAGITSPSCVFGTATGNARRSPRWCVSCSYANAQPISLNSENAAPTNDTPNGRPGAGTTLAGWNPSGTVAGARAW